MKSMKNTIKSMAAGFVMVMAICATSLTAKAAAVKPATPSGLGLYSQEKGTVALDWKFDTNLPYYSDVYPGYYGYEVVVTTLKNKKITTLDEYTHSDYQFSNSTNFAMESSSKVAALASNSKLKTQGFKFKVRSYVFDENQQKVYSDYSKEKVIIPRATITKEVLKNGKVKLTWKKVSGAKSYNVYLSSNNGKSFKKVGSTSKTSYTISKKLTKYKDYYVYIQANKVKYKGKNYSSTKPVDKKSNTSGFYIKTVYK